MTVRFRSPTSADIPGIHEVWRRSLAADVRRLQADWAADGDPLSRALIAVDRDVVLAVVCVVPRTVRDSCGLPRRVGGIAAVATHPCARRRGFARQLLAEAIELMTGRGYTWSLLFTGSPEVYEPLGWRPLAQPAREGALAAPAGVRLHYRVVHGGPPDDWSAIAEVYDRFNRHRPLTAIRQPQHWASGVGARLKDATLFVAGSAEVTVGYACALRTGDTVELQEIAARPDHPDAIDDLTRAVRRWAELRGCRRVVAHVPRDVPLDHLLVDSRPGHPGYAMARPLGHSSIDVETAARDVSARFWLADAF